MDTSPGNLIQAGGDGGGWRPIKTAPRDGTIIEIRCTYGIAPWYGLFRWMETPNTFVFDMTRGGRQERQPGRWAKIGDEDSGFCEGESFTWRPYEGSVDAYVDPTGGAQDRPDYWQAAIAAEAAKYGLPPPPLSGTWFDRIVARLRGRAQ